MKRKIYEQLKIWKEKRQGRCALLIEGARRIGKSYIVEQFGKQEYKSYILVDFNRLDDELLDIFNHHLNKLDDFFSRLQLYYNTKLYVRESLIIFDEVQQYPKARASIKYLVADGRYDYIETGSLISIKKNVANIVIPSEEHPIKMYPMSFEEFLWANGNEMLMPFIKECFEKKKPLETFHRKAMDFLRQYIVVGGMPQVVKTYIETKDFEEVDFQKQEILALYRNDIQKYAKGAETKASIIFNSIPSQLKNHEQKFKMTDLAPNARYREYYDGFFWLNDAKIVNICYNTTEPTIGLRMNEARTTLKCYLADTGLLITQCFSQDDKVPMDIYKKLILSKLEVNEGMIIENLVAQMLKIGGHDLFFYGNADKKNADNRMEIDFLISKSKITNRHNISPIEVKSSNNYTISSLKKWINKYSEQLHTPYVLHSSDLKIEDGITYLPLYMAELL
ncbi:MAG: ATP-binding protein [Bacteroidales bacterium]|nr:ATP-binding protein [Bacteroidales bacterium]